MKTLERLLRCFEVNEYLFKFDLKSGYHHVDIHPEHQKYLGFQWETHDKVKNYVFTVLAFICMLPIHQVDEAFD